MGYLRLVRSVPVGPAPEPPPDHPCIQAFDRELDYVFETLRRLGANASDFEDLAHDVFVVLYRNWPKLDTERPLRPYLFGVAFRIVCAHRRRRSRETPDPHPEPMGGGTSPERALEFKESAELLHAALERVPLERRAVIVMHELDGVPMVDVAKTLGISRFGAYARWRKGRKELEAALRRLARGRRE